METCKTQIGLPEMKDVTSERKTTLGVTSDRLDTVEEKMRNLNTRQSKLSAVNRREKEDEENEWPVSFHRPTVCVIVVPKEGERGGEENILEEMVGEISKFESNSELRDPRIPANPKHKRHH